jgi:hypothetical protein
MLIAFRPPFLRACTPRLSIVLLEAVANLRTVLAAVALDVDVNRSTRDGRRFSRVLGILISKMAKSDSCDRQISHSKQ